MTRAEREGKAAAWLQHLQAWRASGQSLAEYVRTHHLNAWEAYRWRRLLKRRGLWSEEPIAATSGSTPTVQFARVRVKDASAPIAVRARSMLLRIAFGNGRCAELEVADAAQLEEVIGALERAR